MPCTLGRGDAQNLLDSVLEESLQICHFTSQPLWFPVTRCSKKQILCQSPSSLFFCHTQIFFLPIFAITKFLHLFPFSVGSFNATPSANIFCFILYYSANIKFTKKQLYKICLEKSSITQRLEEGLERRILREGFPTAEPPTSNPNSQGVGKGNL